MTTALKEQEVQDAICDSLASYDWTEEFLLRKQAEARLGHKLKHYEFSRAIVALVRADRIERRRPRSNGDRAVAQMLYRRLSS